MKTVIRKMPYEVSQFHETEQWLSDRAAEGLHYDDCMLGFARLIPGEKKQVRYRLEFARGFPTPSDEQKALYAEMGWEYVSTIRFDYFVFRTEDENAPELHTEDEPITQYKKNIFWVQAGLFDIALLIYLFDLYTDIFEYGIVNTISMLGSIPLLVLSLGTVLYLAGRLRDIRFAIQYRRGITKKTTILPTTQFGRIVILVGGLMLLIYSAIPRSHYIQEEPAFPTLAQVDHAAHQELKELLYIENHSERHSTYQEETGNRLRCLDYYQLEQDPLVREEELWQSYSIYPIVESGSVEAEKDLCYRVELSRCLTKGLAQELLKTTLTLNHDRDEWETVAHEGEAAVYALTNDWGQYLILHLGRSVMQVSYNGKETLHPFLLHYEQAMQK